MIENFDKDLFKKCMTYFDRPPVIFDVGAHEGLYTKFALDMIPDAVTFLFEPNEELYHKLCNYKRVFCLAVSDSNDFKYLYTCQKDNDELSSLYPRNVFKEIGFVINGVHCTTIDFFCFQNAIKQIDYLKVDVEGAELDVLNGCPSMMRNKQIKFIQIEYGGTYTDAGIKFTQVINTANLFGYRVYELIENNLIEVTEENFTEDYRYSVFLLTYPPCS